MVYSFLFGIYHSSELFVSTERIELLPIKLEQGQFDRKQLFVKMSELIHYWTDRSSEPALTNVKRPFVKEVVSARCASRSNLIYSFFQVIW